MSYVEHLSETIGPRPATTDAEQSAAHYIRDVFESRGVDAEIQEFESPRTYSWAFVVYHLLTICAALLSVWSGLAALVLGTLVAVVMWMDLNTRWGLTALAPKGPSQNVIARHVPHVGRNERTTKVVVVAHYDSARASLAFSPGMVKNFNATFGLMKWCTYAVPLLILVRMLAGLLPFGSALAPWGWYLTLVPAAYLLVPLLIDVHRELFMHFTPGANDNASGVAAMLGVFEKLVPEPDPSTVIAREPVRSRAQDAPLQTSEGVPEGGLLNYSPLQAPGPRADSWVDSDDDISWDTGVISGQTALGLDAPRSYASAVSAADARPAADVRSVPGPAAAQDDLSMRLFGSVPAAAPAPVPAAAPAPTPGPRAPEVDPDADLFGDVLDESTAPFAPLADEAPSRTAGEPSPAPRRGLFGGRAESAAPAERHGVRDWLGVGSDFDARKKGKDIGSWDNFDDDDDAGRKGGAAAIDDESDPGYSASAAARIRRKVTMNVDRELVEKEVWFVATGAEEVGTVGMKAFLAAYGRELADAVIINLDNVGSGAVAYITREGMAKRYEADRRLVGATRRAVREADLPVKGRDYRGLSTDATPALARGFRAMSIMAFDINGRLPNWHWMTDTADGVAESNLQTSVDLVAAIIKEL
jgi:hypothetical protein